jgi:dethiobiotin synthetase
MRPERLIAVVGTGTEVGKTWVSQQLLRAWRANGISVAARKPVQSFDAGSGPTDAELLASASGEALHAVCPAHRWYARAMAPPMAADILAEDRITLDGLIDEISWPEQVKIGLVETVGGVLSPLAHDGSSADLVRRLDPDDVLLVADAGLGTINSIRLSLQVLAPLRVRILLNRYDATNELHRRNAEWLRHRDGMHIVLDPAALLT